MSILATVQRHREALQQSRRETAIGADLIPRAPHDDERFLGVDLAARGRDVTVLNIGRARLGLSPDDLPAELRERSERIAAKLRDAGPDEIGRWATDVLYAYADVLNIAPTTECAMYLAWWLAIASPEACREFEQGRGPPQGIRSRVITIQRLRNDSDASTRRRMEGFSTMTTRYDKLLALQRRGIPVPPSVRADLEKDTPSPNTRQWRWWAHLWPRPGAATWDRPESLERAQASWDASDTFASTQLELMQERDAANAAEKAAEDAKRAEREQRQRDELEKRLMDEYRQSAPGTTEAEAKAALPDLLHRHRLAERDRLKAAVADAVRRYRF